MTFPDTVNIVGNNPDLPGHLYSNFFSLYDSKNIKK